MQSPPALAEANGDTGGSAAAASQASVLVPALIENSGGKIGDVRILNGNIFDLEDPEEDKLLFRLANKLHIKTKDSVIAQQLLFRPGDDFSRQAIEESERVLRGNRYLQEASIRPVRYENGVVDIEVETSDTWTLMPRISLSRSGGKNTTAVGLKEVNLLGTGVAIEALFKSNVDRDSTVLKVADRNLGNSWYGVEAAYANNSDGFARLFQLGKPFYSLTSRDAIGISLADNDRVDSFYDSGDRVSEYRHQSTNHQFHRGWSRGLENGWTKRLSAGIAFDEHVFSEALESELPVSVIPENRRLLYPFVDVELLQNKFEKTSNHDQINRVEDRFLGTRISARLGYAASGAGSDRDAWIFGIGANTSLGGSGKNSLLLHSHLDGRLEPAGVRNLRLSASARYYRHQSERRLLFATLTGSYGENLDLDQYFVLGGDSGVRGYPLRYQTGDKRVLLTIEQRYFTDWYPLRLFYVGGAIFFDAGRAWGSSPVAQSNDDVLTDVGLGLRLGSSRSALGRMAHIDVAWPLNGSDDIKNVQFYIKTKTSF